MVTKKKQNSLSIYASIFGIYGLIHIVPSMLVYETAIKSFITFGFEALFWFVLLFQLKRKKLFCYCRICLPKKRWNIFAVLWSIPLIQAIAWRTNIPSFLLLFHSLFSAFGEEFVFRAVIPNYLREHSYLSWFWRSVVSSALFAAFHLVNLPLSSHPVLILLQVVYAFCAGMTFYAMAELQKSILPCFVLHFCINLTSSTQIDQHQQFTAGLTSLFSVLFLLIYCAVFQMKKRGTNER